MITPFNDNFNGSDGEGINSLKWSTTGSPSIQGNSAQLTVGDSLTSNYRFNSNFDVQIDFAGVLYPNTNSWGYDFNAYIDSSHVFLVRVAYFLSTKYWQVGWVNGGAWSFSATTGFTRTNTTGKIRIVRTDNYFQAFVVDGSGSFVTKETAKNIGTLGDSVSIVIGMAQWDTNPTVTCKFDNYTINSGYVWPGLKSYLPMSGRDRMMNYDRHIM